MKKKQVSVSFEGIFLLYETIFCCFFFHPHETVTTAGINLSFCRQRVCSFSILYYSFGSFQEGSGLVLVFRTGHIGQHKEHVIKYLLQVIDQSQLLIGPFQAHFDTVIKAKIFAEQLLTSISAFVIVLQFEINRSNVVECQRMH